MILTDLPMNFDTKTDTTLRIIQIAAVEAGGGLGFRGRIPWDCPADRQFFRRQTQGHIVVLGRVTYESLGRPSLPGRRIVVLSSCCPHGLMPVSGEGICMPVSWSQKIERVFEIAAKTDAVIYIGGGARVYAETMAFTDELILSRMHGHYTCDRFYPALPKTMQLVERYAMDGFDVYRYVCRGNGRAFG